MSPGSNPAHKTAAIARSRERRRRRLVLSLAGLVILGAALFAGFQFWFRDSSLVEIRELTVRGVDGSTEEGRQIEAAVKLSTDQMTTMDVKPGVLSDELSRFPRVESSSITVDFPHSATVTVRRRGNGSIFGSGGSALLIATDGTVLGSPGAEVGSLPVIGTGDPPANGRLEGRALDQALVLGAAPRQLVPYLVKSTFGRDGVEVRLKNGMTLTFGDATGLAEKWRAATTMIADPEVPGGSYVDLTVPRRPAVSDSKAP